MVSVHCICAKCCPFLKNTFSLTKNEVRNSLSKQLLNVGRVTSHSLSITTGWFSGKHAVPLQGKKQHVLCMFMCVCVCVCGGGLLRAAPGATFASQNCNSFQC